MKERLTITVERTHAGYTISTIRDDQLIRRRYIGYSKRDAIREFKEEIRETMQ